MVDSRARWALALRRIDGHWVPAIGRGQVESGLLGRPVDLEEIYLGSDVAASEPPRHRHRLRQPD